MSIGSSEFIRALKDGGLAIRHLRRKLRCFLETGCQSFTSRLTFGLAAAIVGTTAFLIAATRDWWGIGSPDVSVSH